MSQPKEISTCVTVLTEDGFHMRPISAIAKRVRAFAATVTIGKGDCRVAADSVMQMLLLAAEMGDELVITAVGEDAEEAIAILEELFANQFKEG